MIHASPITFEIASDSERQRELLWVVFREQTTRIGVPMPALVLWGQRSRRNDAYAFHTVDVYELKLPK